MPKPTTITQNKLELEGSSTCTIIPVQSMNVNRIQDSTRTDKQYQKHKNFASSLDLYRYMPKHSLKNNNKRQQQKNQAMSV